MATPLDPGAGTHHVPRDQAHPQPGSVAELEDAFRTLQHLRGPERDWKAYCDDALDVALRLIYREIVWRSPGQGQPAPSCWFDPTHTGHWTRDCPIAARRRLGLGPDQSLVQAHPGCDIHDPLTEAEGRLLDGNR